MVGRKNLLGSMGNQLVVLKGCICILNEMMNVSLVYALDSHTALCTTYE